MKLHPAKRSLWKSAVYNMVLTYIATYIHIIYGTINSEYHIAGYFRSRNFAGEAKFKFRRIKISKITNFEECSSYNYL